MNRVIEIVLTKKMVIARVGVIALVLVIFAGQVFLLVKPASAGVVGHRMNISPRIHSQGINDSQAQDITPSDLATRRILECKAAAWLANVNPFSASYPDAKAEYCKALVAASVTTSDLAMKRALDCAAIARMASKETFSARYSDAKAEYCKALVAASVTTSDLAMKRALECEAVVWTASEDAFSARYPDAKTEYCKALALHP